MNNKMLTILRYAVVAVIIATAISESNAQEGVSRSLEGVWEVMKTPRNCTTGEPVGAAFEALVTFHRDGKLTSSASNLNPLSFHGLWQRELGWSDYSFRQKRFIRNPDQSFAGKQEVGGTVTLSESGDEFTSDEVMILFSIDGVPGPPFCLTSVGTRFKLEP
ncbi:MAG TPA: hypothetical protein DEA22_01770 [Blastocatellia bacterium]|nr:hypothetical protein [Blastocatellia bacterium]